MTTNTREQHIQLSSRSWIRHVRDWADPTGDDLAALQSELDWQQEYIHLYGRTVPQPRLTAVCGRSMNPASRYRRPNPTQPWTPTTEAVLRRVTAEVPDWHPNGLIANLYRDGSDSISFHADNEPTLGDQPTVASVSYGASRRFQLKPKAGGAVHVLDLNHGDLLIMGGATQAEYLHAITKTKRVSDLRLSLTFRRYHSHVVR